MISPSSIHTVAQKLLDVLNEATPENPSSILSKKQHDAARALLCHSPAHVKLWAMLAQDVVKQRSDRSGLLSAFFWLGIAQIVGVPSPDIGFHRMKAARELVRDDVAISLGLTQIEAEPFDHRLYTLLALCLCEQGALDAGTAYGKKSVLLDPSNGEALNGLLFVNRSGPDDLLWRWIKCLDADEISIRFHHATCLLEHERWQEGWDAHRVRMDRPNYRHIWRHPMVSEWQGESVDHLLLCPEEGMGDQLRSLGYLQSLRPQAGKVSIVLHPRLHRFVKRALPWLNVLDHRDAEQQVFDAQLMLEDAGCYGAHIRQPIMQYKSSSRRSKRHRIGIAWFGGADGRLSARRSIAPEQLVKSLSGLPADLISLQHKVSLEDQARFERMGVVFDPHINPMGDAEAYAEEITKLDAVVSVTNTVVHMAGLLGVPTFCLAPYYAQWYWAVGGRGNLTYPAYWYPTVRIFRQAVPGDWGDPLNRLRTALSNFKPVED